MRRFKQGVKQMQTAQKLIVDAGMEPQEVPMRTLVPLIEGGSTDDEEDMSARWAALLANAASGETNVHQASPTCSESVSRAGADP